MLQFVNVKKSYNDKLVVDVPVFQLGEGIYWLQGINGSGKTTLLRMIAGLLPFDGDIILNEISFRRSPVNYRKQISWSDAEPEYPSFITAQELIAFYQNVKLARPEQIEKLVTMLQINNFVNNRIGTYSSGTIKKLSLLLAFIGNPSLILLDEPLTTLDAEAVPLLLQLIKDTNEKQRTSFLLSSHHNLEEGMLSIDKKLQVVDQTLSFLA